MKLVQFGAGNIGRSFIGQLFSRSGWDVVFVDVNPRIVSLLNEAGWYPVVVKRDGSPDERRSIGPVRAVDGRDTEAVVRELVSADMAASSVGKGAVPHILPVLARGLGERFRVRPDRPLDIIIAENLRGAANFFRTSLAAALGSAFPLDRMAGLIETSIGKMVPLMRAEDLREDPLLLFAEEYETLIVDARGFRGPPVDVAGLYPVDAVSAYVDRKLFIHNLGHAAAAYLGYRAEPEKTSLAEVLAAPEVERGARRAMKEAAAALVLEYPGVYSRSELTEHIEDLLRRFKNRALGDTVFRVGRDVPRKLSRDDRVTGATLLCARHGRPFEGIAEVYRAALGFAASGEDGLLFPEDARFRREYLLAGQPPRHLEHLLTTLSGLNPAQAADKRVMDVLLGREDGCGAAV
ncbi:MAG: mannitol-1-phosphate 5-dehydrogenase [Spirochaetaceae bacterium]|jgi:mannitol-1-phosphate 5-dehydrogenase|nr:mannitol-1-phosphate 5-dehydrogenase [Spirochaetaceae bacterium]